MNALILYGSRNPNGQTARAGHAIARGLSRGGAAVEECFLPPLRLERCRQCEDSGWGRCRREGRCVIEDDFAAVVEKVNRARAVVLATPVYYSDLSESLRAFTDRLRRICTHEKTRPVAHAKPAVGLCVAGGGGGGGPACCVSLERVLATCGFEVADLIPVRRQNLDAKVPGLEHVGEWLAAQPPSA